MEAFEERAQMAKEVLRATSNQTSRQRGTPPPVEREMVGTEDSGGADASQDGGAPDPSAEREEDVRFSEDLTISVKRRRKLFGR
jgi:hypothetical protein